MGKFGTLVPNEKPWDDTVSTFPNRKISINSVEETTTQYGPSYLLHSDVTEQDGEVIKDIVLLCGGKLLVKQISTMLNQMKDTGEHFPVDVVLRRIRGREQSYLQFFDIDDPVYGVDS